MAYFRILLCVLACMFGTVVAAEDDKDWLTRIIQDELSGAGRAVEIDGFRGALSSEAAFDQMTISDADGIWLTLHGAQLIWNRGALLRGRLEVENLTAKRLEIARLPKSDEPAVPSAEAPSFALPNLPVSVALDRFEVSEIHLGPTILGEPVALVVNAQAQLTDEQGVVDFTAQRIDDKRGSFKIMADLNRDAETLTLDLTLSEEAKGVAARLLDLPGLPSTDLHIKGAGPLTDFASDVRLSTDGQERLAGQITLGEQTPRRGGSEPDRRVIANIGGDITAVLAPQYRDFFGTSVGLTLDALLEPNGAIELAEFTLDSAAAQLRGKANLNAEKWPTFLDIQGQIQGSDGAPVALPGGGGKTFVRRMALDVDYDAKNGEAYSAVFDIRQLTGETFGIDQTSLRSEGTLQGDMGSVGQLLGDFDFAASGVSLTDTALAEAFGSELSGKATVNLIEDQPIRIEDLTLTGADYGLTGRIIIGDLADGFLTRLNARLDAKDLSRFSALAGREMDGQAALALQGSVTPLSGQFDLDIEGTTDDLTVGIPQADAVMSGRTALTLTARRNESGTFVRDLSLRNAAIMAKADAELTSGNSHVEGEMTLADLADVEPKYQGPVTLKGRADQDSRGWSVDVVADAPYGAKATINGLATGPDAALNFSASVPQIRDYVAAAPLAGRVAATGVLQQTDRGWVLVTDANAPNGILARVEGLVAPKVDVAFDMSIPDGRPLAPQLKGPLKATGQLRQTDQGFYIDTNASGPSGARVHVEGLATGPDMALTVDAAVASVAAFAPGIRGGATAKGLVRQTDRGISVNITGTGPYAARGDVSGIVTGPDVAVDFNVLMPNLGAVVPKLAGPLKTGGSARKTPQGWQVQVDANGPSGTQATLAGLVGNDGNLAMKVTGNGPLGLSAPFIAPRSLQGPAAFDLTVNGPPQLSSVTGTIRTSNASLSAPNLRIAFENIAALVTLQGNRAQIDMTAAASNGGQLAVNGSVVTTGSLSADLGITLADLVLIDPRLFRTSVSGALRVAGPLTGGGSVTGQIDVGETQVTVPSTGLTSGGDIPLITHVGSPSGVNATRKKAGLTATAADQGSGAAAAGPAFGLNVRVSAPNRIFVRGRGLDAELGGALALTGSTNRIISAGRFDLLRGRLDILGKRFNLREGSIQFQGGLIPYIRFVSAAATAEGEVRVIVDGPANEPEIVFESTPDAPQDEVLAQLLFGRNIAEISAFQALQLANAVAVLAGKSGGGVVTKLRDGFGLDDLDVTTTTDGATALRVGKYLTDNIYTDVTTTSEGEADVSLNLDLSENLKAKISVGSDGDSGLGIYFEKDY